VAAAFEKARHVSRLTLRSQRLVGNPMEPRACAASYDATADVHTVYTPTQGVNGMRGALAALTKVPKERLRVVAQDVGGSFGIRGAAYAEHAVVMAAAKRLGRPVKWVGTRSELFLGDTQGRALELTGEIALDAAGRMLAAQADGRAVVTIEGLARTEALHPVQRSFTECHALQCGFCTPGMIMATAGLLAESPDPTDAEINHALEGNLCRCTGYVNIVSAVKRAAELLRG